MPFCKLAIASALISVPAFAQDPGGANQVPPEPRSETKIVVPGLRKLTVGGQYRLRYEGMFDYDLDNSAGSAASNDFFTQRVRLNLGLDFSDKLGGFVQLQDAREWGEEASTTDDSADGFDLHQGYLDVHGTPGIGGDTRVGRQEINLGDQRLVGSLDWKTGARSLDGVLHTWSYEGGSLHLWGVQAREAINAVNDDARFVGAYHAQKYGERLTGDFYAMYLQDDGTAPGTSHNRVTLGTRWIGSCCDPLEFGIEVATQFGEQSGRDVPIGDTYAGHVHGKYRFDMAWQPTVTLAWDVASGDDPNTSDNERFNNLFPTAHAHWGMMDLAQWENLQNPWVRLAVSPCPDCDIALSWQHLAAMEAGDAFRGPATQLSAGNPTFSKVMGEEIDLLYTKRLHVGDGIQSSLHLGYGLFLPGNGAKDANGTDDLAHFVYAQFDVRF